MKGIAARNIMLIKPRTFLQTERRSLRRRDCGRGTAFSSGEDEFRPPGGRSNPMNPAAVTRNSVSARRSIYTLPRTSNARPLLPARAPRESPIVGDGASPPKFSRRGVARGGETRSPDRAHRIRESRRLFNMRRRAAPRNTTLRARCIRS
jgi:hypothetical protein